MSSPAASVHRELPGGDRRPEQAVWAKTSGTAGQRDAAQRGPVGVQQPGPLAMEPEIDREGVWPRASGFNHLAATTKSSWINHRHWLKTDDNPGLRNSASINDHAQADHQAFPAEVPSGAPTPPSTRARLEITTLATYDPPLLARQASGARSCGYADYERSYWARTPSADRGAARSRRRWCSMAAWPMAGPTRAMPTMSTVTLQSDFSTKPSSALRHGSIEFLTGVGIPAMRTAIAPRPAATSAAPLPCNPPILPPLCDQQSNRRRRWNFDSDSYAFYASRTRWNSSRKWKVHPGRAPATEMDAEYSSSQTSPSISSLWGDELPAAALSFHPSDRNPLLPGLERLVQPDRRPLPAHRRPHCRPSVQRSGGTGQPNGCWFEGNLALRAALYRSRPRSGSATPTWNRPRPC
jgi:hypothetical protein